MITAGEKLRITRNQLGLTLDQVEKGTRIKKQFLSAIERNDYNSLPSPAYAQGFVRNYAHFLGISRHEIMPLFKRQYDEKKAYDVLPKGFTRQEEIPVHRVRIRRTLVVLLIIIVFFLGYIGFQSRSLFIPPSLSVASPKDGSTVGQDITVSGTTDPNGTLYINNTLVAINDDGSFTKHIIGYDGRTVIKVTVRNRFGKESTIQRTVIVKSRP